MTYYNTGLMIKDVKELLSLWDYSKNNELGLSPDNTPVNSRKEVFWICENGHSWKERVSKIYGRKTKCLYCSGRFIKSGYNDLKSLYPEIAAEWNFEKNGITPDKISPKDTNVYWWKCKNGHPSFQRSVTHRVNRHDKCPYCSGRKAVSGVNDLKTLFPKIAAEWDYENNGGVVPDEVSAESWTPYRWICPKGHRYSMKVHLRTHSIKSIDCPKCVKAHSTSFPEQAIYFYAKQYFADAINRYKGLSKTGLELDIYIPSLNAGIEYDGKHFHSLEDTRERDRNKYKICQKRGIKLIRVCEGEPSEAVSLNYADKIYYIKTRANDFELNAFLYSFLTDLAILNRNMIHFSFDVDIKRDRPVILEYLIDIENSFGSTYPDLAKNWDQESNGKLTPFMFSSGSNYKAFFKCKRCGRSWSATIVDVIRRKRTLCKKCSMGDNGIKNTKRIVMERGSLGQNCKEAIEQWDWDANNDLTPYDIPLNYRRAVFWKCPNCGYKWSQSPNARLTNGKPVGCPHCTGRVALSGTDDLQTLYPEVAKEWDFEKNKGVLPSQIRPHSNVKRYWICSKHNIGYFSSPANRIKHSSCPMCQSEKRAGINGIRVDQYNKELKYIQTFRSVSEAGRLVKINPGAIREAVLHGWVSANYYWKYEGTEFGHLKPDKKLPVIRVDIKTGESVEYESAIEANRKTGIAHSHILRCCRRENNYNTAGGFYWHFKGEDLIIRRNKTTGKAVVGINIKTNEKIEYDSASAAGKSIGISKSSVSKCCKGRQKSAGGYIWKYK